MHTTPLRFSPGHHDGTPGVEVHVHALSQMMAGDKIRVPSPLWLALIVYATALGGAALGRSTNRWWVSITIVLVGLAGAIGVAFGAFHFWSFMMPITV
jgi:adenylate cyclase